MNFPSLFLFFPLVLVIPATVSFYINSAQAYRYYKNVLQKVRLGLHSLYRSVCRVLASLNVNYPNPLNVFTY